MQFGDWRLDKLRTNGQYMYDKVVELREKLAKIEEELDEAESYFFGAEIDHPDFSYCIIKYIDGDDVHLYVEDGKEEQHNLFITFEEFRDLLYT